VASKPVEAVLFGAGGRGRHTFGQYALRNADRLKFVAVAEPDAQRRETFAREHGIATEHAYPSWEDLLARPQMAPALFNATMDPMHADSTMAALEAGYHVLLEKPLAVDAVSCVRLVRKAQQNKRILQLGYTLRYAPFFEALNQMLTTGRIGQMLHVDHTEKVAYWHMAHSFVRGNWGNVARSGPMILAKCCHDMDLLAWMVDRPAVRVASFGALTHFRADWANSDIPKRCTDGCPIEPDCPYSAIRMYLGENTDWPVSAISPDTSMAARREAVETGPYGRCVYRCDNDVVDHQVVAIEFADDVTVSLTMEGHTVENTRTMRYSGTEGEICGHMAKNELRVHDFASGQECLTRPGSYGGGHGGGDPRMCDAFVEAVRADDPSAVLASAEAGLEGHLLCFAAEQARSQHRVVEMDAFRREIESAADKA